MSEVRGEDSGGFRVSVFEGTTFDSCGVSVNETQVTGWVKVVFCGIKELKRLDLVRRSKALARSSDYRRGVI